MEMKKTSADDSAEAAAALLMMNTASADSSSTGKAFRPSSLSDARAAGCEIPIGSAAVYGNRVIPHENDILNGRGNGVNSHPGNVQFRTFVAAFKRRYVGGGIAVKREVTKHVLSLIRSLDPPGRFLKQNPLTDAWEELDEETSFKKTSQALREKAPALRKQYMLIPNAADVAMDKETSIESMDTTSNEGKLPEKKPQPEEKTPEVIYSSPEKKIKSSSKSAKEAAAAAKKAAIRGSRFLFSSSLFDTKTPLKELQYIFNYRTFSIFQSPARSSKASTDLHSSRKKLNDLAVVASSNPLNLTSLFIMTKMCSDAFEIVSGPTRISVADDDVLIGAEFNRKKAHPGNAALAAQLYAYHGISAKDILITDSSKTVNHKNTRFFEKDKKSGRWIILSMKEAKIVMDSLVEQTIRCCFEPSNVTDVLMTPATDLRGCKLPKMNHPKNQYFDLLLHESKTFFKGSDQMKDRIAREVVQNVMGRQGKFLEYDRLSATWVVVHPIAALDFTFKSLNAISNEDDSNEENSI